MELGGNCHENGESVHKKINDLQALAIFMLRDAPEAHDLSSV
jgi:hypothetical protein